MKLQQLETFVRVAELGSFSKAAVVLRVAQPALSRQVRQLETDLRVTLLQRTGRGVVLTPAGQRLFERALGILQSLEQAKGEVASGRDEPVGRVVLGLPPSLSRQLTVPVVAAMQGLMPKVRLSMVEGLSAHLCEWIASGRVDLGLVYNPDPHQGLEATPVRDERLCLVGPCGSDDPAGPGADAAHAGADAATPITLKKVCQLPLVVPERTHSMRRLLETQALRAGWPLQIAWEVSSVPAILALVRAGYGHAVLTRSAVAMSGRPEDFSLRPIAAPQLVVSLCQVVSSQRQATPAMRHLMPVLLDLVAKVAPA